MTAGGQSGGDLYAELVSELLETEDKRRTSLEARGASVITISGTLVTLLLAVTALVTKETATFTLPPVARDRLSLAVAAFVLAAMLAIATAVPQPARMTDPKELKRLLPQLWDHGTDFALINTTATRLEQLENTQRANDFKAFALMGAVIAQVFAVLLLAWAVLGVL